ncbi:hypothetical protein GCM10009838_29890 [Catenulispora subtropica]|uniref:Uncharacterized protein n=1 Tax=Catenulispora subtropica TaxID=450798 RepID=A0ABN2RHJ9_9ACTN
MVQPGVIRTELWDGSVPDARAFLQGAGSELLTRCVGTVGEAAAAYVFPLSDAFRATAAERMGRADRLHTPPVSGYCVSGGLRQGPVLAAESCTEARSWEMGVA